MYVFCKSSVIRLKAISELDILIKRAGFEDCVSMAQVLSLSFAEFEHLYTEKAFLETNISPEEVKARLVEGPAWIALQHNEIVGTASILELEDHVYIRGMAIVPMARGVGLGSKLLQKIENYAIESGTQQLRLSTTPFLDSAIKLYKRFGFKFINVPPHDLYGTELLSMQKMLGS